MAELHDNWEARGKPPTLFRRFQFERYAQTREFLDALSTLIETSGIHPQNINFGTTYVNITLQATEGEALTEVERGLATQINELSRGAGA